MAPALFGAPTQHQNRQVNVWRPYILTKLRQLTLLVWYMTEFCEHGVQSAAGKAESLSTNWKTSADAWESVPLFVIYRVLISIIRKTIEINPRLIKTQRDDVT